MTQTQAIQASQSNPDSRIPLTPDEEWALVADVQARTQLLKSKKEGLTMAEKRICIRGERALRLLVQDCHRLIWWHVHRSSFSRHIPRDEMYQLGVMCVEQAANSHNPNKPGKQRSFKNWVSFQLKQRFIECFRKEFRYQRRNKAACDQQIHSECVSNGYTPFKSAFYQALREKLDQIITTSLTDQKAKLIQAHYWHGKDSANIAAHFGIKRKTVNGYLYESRKQLRDNPQLQELARLY